MEVVRESLVLAATESALMGHGRVFILPMVERLRHEAANALLKILEEPPADTHIIMTPAVEMAYYRPLQPLAAFPHAALGRQRS